MMLLLANLIGILITTLGVAFVIQPSWMRKFMNFIKIGKNAYVGGVLRIVFGIILLLASGQSSVPTVTVALAVIFLLGGIIIFAIGTEKISLITNAYLEQSDLVLRLLGIITAIFGVMIIYVI